MRIPASLSLKRPLFQAAAWLTIALVATAYSCRTKTDSQSRNVETLRGEPATLDARGSIVDSNVYLQNRITEGVAGNGGSIRIASTAGAMVVRSQARSFDVKAIRDALKITSGLGVAGGDVVEVRGGLVLGSLNIGPGGLLILTDSTNIQVNGNVLVEGTIRSRAESSAIRRDGHDLTIRATGSMVVTGTINCSGADADNTPAANTSGTADPRNPTDVGGNGGEIFISTGGDITITGKVLAEGGSTDSVEPSTAVAGQGGRIFVGSGGGLLFAGKMSARAGNSFTNSGSAPSGGAIQLIALGDVTFDETTRFDASGGRNSGAVGGNGGSISIEGSAGPTTIGGVDLDVSGGKLFFTSGAAGNAGSASITGQTIDLSDMTINGRGGNVVDERQQFTSGPGGAGAIMTLSATDTIIVAPDVVFNARGGDSLGTASAGGDGGSFLVIAAGTPGLVTFDGSSDIRGGNNFGGQEGTAGTSCVTTPDSQQSLVNIIGSNHFPVGLCTNTNLDSFTAIVHDLDCSDDTIMPGTSTVELPAVIGKDLYRVFVGSADSLSLATSGESTGNVNLFVGDFSLALDSALASDPANYQVQSTGLTSSENVTISDLAGCTGVGVTLSSLLGPDPTTQYVTVLVAEANAFVETYTLTVSCASTASILTCGGTTSGSGVLTSTGETSVFEALVGASTSVTISVAGSSNGINLHVGGSCILGSTTPGDYAVHAETNILVPTSSHSITLDSFSSPSLSALATSGGVLSILVEETTDEAIGATVPESFTVSITCN